MLKQERWLSRTSTGASTGPGHRKYFDGTGFLSDGQPLLESVYTALGIERTPDLQPSTHPPLDFTIAKICFGANFRHEQLAALRRMRRLTVAAYCHGWT